MARTLASYRDRARAQLDDPSIVAAIPALAAHDRSETAKFVRMIVGARDRSEPALFIVRPDRIDVHEARRRVANVGDLVGSLDPKKDVLRYVEWTREDATRIDFGPMHWTVLDQHMKALYTVTRKLGFTIEADDDPRAAEPA